LPTSNVGEPVPHLKLKSAIFLRSSFNIHLQAGITGCGERSSSMNVCPKFPKNLLRFAASTLFLPILATAPATGAAQYLSSLPRSLAGSWRITRMLPTTNSTCWSREQAQPLLGTTITYRSNLLRWHNGHIQVTDISLRDLSGKEFREENPGPQSPASFEQLGIHATKVTEVDIQHEDSDILPATTAVPGDSVLLAGPNRIVISACGIYFEATRATDPNSTRSSDK
jgi:hypothetical protein